MKTKLIIAVLGALFAVATGSLFANSHPDSDNNGKDSPRFYASPHGHPEHP